MPRLLLFFFTVIFTNAALARGYPDHILFKDFNVQFNALDSIFRNSVSAENGLEGELQYIKELEEWADRKDDLPLKYGFSIIKSRLLLNKRKADAGTFEKELSKLLAALQQDKLHLHAAQVYQVLASFYWEHKKYALAFENYIKAYNIYSVYSPKDFPPKTDYTAEFGGRYYYFKDYGTARKYFLEAAASDGYSNISLLNTVALCYNSLGKYDSARYYFALAFTLAEKRNELQWIGLLSGNLGYTYFLCGKSDEALPLLEKELRITLELHQGDKFNAANTLVLMSDIYLQRSEKQKALQLALKAYELATESFAEIPYEVRTRLYPSIARAYAANGLMDKAYLFLDSASVAKDTVAKRTNVLVLAGAQHNMDADKHLAEIQKYEHKQRMHALTRDILIAGLGLLAFIGILIFRNEKVKARAKQEQLEAANKQAETELANASKQLKGFTESLSEKNELIEKFTAEMNRMQRDIDAGTFGQYEMLQKLQHATILTDDQWRDFQRLFGKVHKGFMDRLNAHVPGLSPIDKRFMLLSKLRLSKKEMSAMLGISQEAVLQNCHRIRQRLDIDETDKSLEDFADTI